jgi:hypothetical protein
MGEADCSKSSNIATLKFELNENPILDLKSRHRHKGSKLEGPKKLRTRIRKVIHYSTTLKRPLVCRSSLATIEPHFAEIANQGIDRGVSQA